MSRKILAGDTVFETARLIIRAAREADAAMYYALWMNPQVMTNVGFPQGLRITQEEIVAKIREQRMSEFERRLVVELKATGQEMGECTLHLPDEEGIAGTDVKLLPEFWGNKYGVEVKQGLVDYLFTHTNCTAVQATPNVNNIASIKMQEAVGGVRVDESVYEFPEEMRDWTCPVHSYIYRVFRADWERGRVSIAMNRGKL
ncbi:MAG: GNAT family N-acetyltransferase [Chloroflexi bacterium]|nr:GNAT family N-acetyltransferase [Chloroflexota bacterium]